MGTSRSWVELDRKLEALARDASDMPKGQVSRSALMAKKSVQVLMPDRLRGVGKNGRKLAVKYVESGSGSEAEARVFVTGPAQLIERDTKAHPIPKVRGTRARRRYAVIGGHPFSRANHPGTKGKHPWAKGVDAAVPLIKREFDAAGALLLRRHF